MSKFCLMFQDNIIKEKNCKDEVQTILDLMKPLKDFLGGSHAFNNDFAFDDTERNDYASKKSEKVAASFALKLDVVNYSLYAGDLVLDNSFSTTACNKKKNDFVNGQICDLI